MTEAKNVVVVSAQRTPLGKSGWKAGAKQGILYWINAQDFGRHCPKYQRAEADTDAGPSLRFGRQLRYLHGAFSRLVRLQDRRLYVTRRP